VISVISFIVVFSIVVLSHELGHYFFARRAGIKVLELALGFGPRLIKTVRNGVTYAVNLLPFGGFIKIAGINPEVEDKDDRYLPEESYLSKRPFQKFLTILGGPLANFLLAFLIFSVMFATLGIPAGVSNTISKISDGSEAERIGLLPRDRIIEVNGQKVIDMAEKVMVIHNSTGKKVTLKIERNGRMIELTAVPRLDKKLNIGLIGFSLEPRYSRVNIPSAVWQAGEQTVAVTLMIVYMLGMLMTGHASVTDVAGPVGIASFTGQAASAGMMTLLSWTAFLSINLGIVNLLPIPAFDGGRIIFILIESIRRKPLDIKLENRIHYIGMFLMLVLLFIITMNDILKIFLK